LIHSIYLASAQTDNCSNNITLKWSTFQGGNGTEEVVDIYVDPITEQIYSIARTTSANLLVTNGDLGLGGVDKTYVQCMNNNGTLIWSTLISDWKTPHNIYVDNNANVILFGHTTHNHLPMTGAGLDKSFDGSSDMVYFKLDPTGSSILASSYIGGNGYEHIKGLNTNIDFHDNYLYGVVSTSSTDIMTSTNALSNTIGQAFIFSYDFNVEDFVYKSYYDYSASNSTANFEESAGTESLKIDQSGNVYLMLWNSSNDYTLTSHYITSNAIIPNYPVSGFNYPPLILVLDNLFNQTYGSYISNIIDNGIPGGQFNTSVYNGTPGYHNWFGFDIDIDNDGSIYVLQNSKGFRGPIHADLSGALSSPIYIGPNPINNYSSGPKFFIGTNIIKISANSLSDYQVDYVHHIAYGNGGNPNKYKFAIDKEQQINLIETTSYSLFNGTHQGMPSANYSPPFVESTGLTSFTIFEKESDEIIYHIRPSEDPILDYNNPNLITGRLYDVHLSNFDIYLFGKTASSSYPTTPSFRDQDLSQQIFTQQPDYASGDSDGFITVLHSASPPDNNAITDFDLADNTFCTNSYIHQNYGPLDGSSISWLSGDGSQSNHVVPDIKRDNYITKHPIQFNSSFIQWQKSYDNINWIDIPGAKQEDYSPTPEAQSATVYYRRIFNSCSSTVESNVATAIISGNNDMIVDVGPAPYQHCTFSVTPMNITVTGGSGDFSWHWYNGYAPTTDITPSSGSSTSGITAEVASAVDGGGVYRIVITDNNTGCEIEALVTVRVPSVSFDQQYYLCPGQTTCVNIGPSFTDPFVMYQWTGPNGFTSSLASICVTDLGVYTLTLNGCSSTLLSTELIQNAYDANLTTIPDYTFCQLDAATTIGMPTTAPAGYTFQWAPTQNISDITAYNPNYNPLIELPSTPQNYTFTALRESDGCVFEQNLDITLHKHVDVNGIADDGFCSGSDNLNLINFDGNYVEWEIIATTFPGGLSALQSDPLFSFDGSSQLTSSSLSPIITYPQLTSNEYTITIDIIGSSIPFPNTCFDDDNVLLTIYESCGNIGGCTSCPTSSCNWSVNANLPPGSDGLCGGVDQLVTLGPSGTSNTYEWSIISIDDTPISGSPLIGIFDETGTLLIGPGPHPNTVIMDIDNPSQGAYDNISYEMTTTSITGIVCKDTLKVYSSAIYGPVVDLIPEFTTCNLGISGPILQSGSSIPLTINGQFYNSAPNTNIDWFWQGSAIQNRDTPFPTFLNSSSRTYTATATDILSGCRSSDVIEIIVSDVSDGAGPDISNVCSGSIVQIPGPEDNSLFTYDWEPPVGLNFPIGTPNNIVASPFATVDQDINYVLTTTAPGCTTEDLMMISTSTAPPPNHPDQNYNACLGDVIQVELDPTFIQNCNGCTYSWSHISGGNLNYLNSTNTAQPVISIPVSQINSTIQFQLETIKGNCGSDVMLVTINVSIPDSPQIPQTMTIDCGLPLNSIIVSNHIPGNQYEWSSINGLYEDPNMSIPLANNITNLPALYVYINANQTYNVSTIINGCYSDLSSISVINNLPLISNAGVDTDLCFGTNSASIGPSTNPYTSSTMFTWTPTGINSDPYANTFAQPTAAEEADMSSWLSNATTLNPIIQQGAFLVGSYEFTLTIQDGNCTDSDKMIVRVLDTTFPSGFAGQPQTKCTNDCFYLLDNPNPDYSYTWTPFPSSEAANMTFSYSNNPLVCPQTDVTYTVYLTENSTGCTSHTESVSFTLFPSPAINDHYEEVCQFGSTYDLTSFFTNYNQLTNPVWEINDGTGTVIANPTTYVVNQDVELIVRDQNQYGCMVEAVVTFENLSAGLNADSFYHLVGNTDNNQSKRVKFYDDHIYLAYNNVINGLARASMVKYDRLGNLIWHTSLDYTSSINDFILDEECQIMAVGHKGEFSVSKITESLIVRFDADNGNVINSQTNVNGGREEFTKIVRQTVGANTDYYISGTFSGDEPSNIDITSLYKYSLNGTFIFSNAYTVNVAQLDEESHRGLLELSDGSILLVGNHGPTGYGLAIKINGTNGNFIDGLYTDQIIDFYDALETPNGNIILVGEKFDSDEGIVVLMDQNLNFLSSQLFSNITDFRNIIHTAGDNYLLAGKTKGTLNYPVLFSIDYSSNLFTVNNGYYVENFESDYESVWFDYDPINNKVAYADSRLNNPNGFGDYDILLGIFDTDLFTPCTEIFTPIATSNPVTATSVNFNKYDFIFSSGTASNTSTTNLLKNDIVCGCEDNAISFDGIDDHLSTTGFSTNGDYTISAWFNNDMVSNGTAEDRILSFGPSNRLEIGIEEDSGGATDGFLWIYDQGLGSVQTFGQNIRDGMWHHVGVVRSGNNVDVFLDGVMAGSYPSNTGYSHGPNLSIGNWANIGSPSFFKGSIDEVSIWDVALSANDIAELMSCKLLGYETGLVSYYDMNQGMPGANNTAITQILDSGPGGNDLDILYMSLDGQNSNIVCSAIGLGNSCDICTHPDLPGLQSFYDAANGDQWTNTINNDKTWFEDCDPCGLLDGTPWFGITCDGNDRVSQLRMNSNNLTGIITPDIDLLPRLRWFVAYNNSLSGEIPPSFCNLNLLHFRAPINNFTGSIPSCFDQIPNLTSIVAFSNNFTGPLPAFTSTTLGQLQINDNGFTGTIPVSYASLPLLNTLDLSNNNLSGCYDLALEGICTSTLLTTNQNQYISAGNTFNAAWEDFCATGDGQCCETDIILDAANLVSGVYSASLSITVSGCINPPLDITFNAPTVTYDIDFEVKLGATVSTLLTGCQ